MEKRYCQYCRWYKHPRCNLLNKFTARKSTCKGWQGKKLHE